MDKRPLREVKGIKFQFGSQPVLEVPADWIVQVLPLAGQINIVPGAGSARVNPAVYWPYSGQMRGDLVPGWYVVTYEAGWDESEIPGDELHLMGMYAAMFALHPAGDLLGGAGIAARSVSLDGVSQSIETTSSATNAGYGARIINYWKDIELLKSKLRRKYYGFGLEVA